MRSTLFIGICASLFFNTALAAVSTVQEEESEIKPFNPFELRDKSIRLENEALTEGIQSADGRWFDVEIIIFERTNSADIREQFAQEIESKKPKQYWDIQNKVLKPNLSQWLTKLPNCFAQLDPLHLNSNQSYPPFNSVAVESDEEVLPSVFFERFQQYKSIIRDNWIPTNELCLMPSERLPLFWRQYLEVNFLATRPFNLDTNLFTDFPQNTMPTTILGYDHDDFRDVYVLDEANLKLKSYAEQINRKRGLKTLLHVAWRQPGLSPANAIPVYLVAGNRLTEEFYYDGSQKINTKEAKSPDLSIDASSENETPPLVPKYEEALTIAQQLDIKQVKAVDSFMDKIANGAAIDPISQELTFPKRDLLPTETWTLDGYIKVKLDHYLFLEADFNYREPVSISLDVAAIIEQENLDEKINIDASSDEVLISAVSKDNLIGLETTPSLELKYLKNYPLQQERRTYSGDVHYLDHPKFGIVFQIRKYRH